jgi:outer membrane protein assembly factor BamB
MKIQTLLQRMIPFIVLLFIVCSGVWIMSQRATAPGRRGLGESFKLDSQQHLETDPALLIATEAEPIPAHLTEPLNFCIGPDNRLYLVGDGHLVSIEPNGEVGNLALDFKGTPHCVAVSADGTIYVGVDDHVETYDKTGKQLAVWPVPENGCQAVGNCH